MLNLPKFDSIPVVQILEGLGAHARLMVSLYPTLLTYSKEDQDDEVCSNSVYALGILAANALPEMLRCARYMLRN